MNRLRVEFEGFLENLLPQWEGSILRWLVANPKDLAEAVRRTRLIYLRWVGRLSCTKCQVYLFSNRRDQEHGCRGVCPANTFDQNDGMHSWGYATDR